MTLALADTHEKFKAMLTHRYFIRAHMVVMLSLVVLAGVAASRAMLLLGVRGMAWRYPFAVIASYLVFFLLIRLWLSYVARASGARRRDSSSDSGGSGSGASFDLGGGSAKGGGSGLFKGGGGKFGGGGSSGSFEGGTAADARPTLAVAAAQPQAASASSKGGSSSSVGGLDIDGDGLILLILFALLVAAILGVGAYVGYQAPAILSEAAFQAVLVPGLVKTSKNAHDSSWERSVFRATAIPFAVVLVLALLFGYEAGKRCPSAATVRQVFHTCIFR